jgi:hypothetical protein
MLQYDSAKMKFACEVTCMRVHAQVRDQDLRRQTRQTSTARNRDNREPRALCASSESNPLALSRSITESGVSEENLNECSTEESHRSKPAKESVALSSELLMHISPAKVSESSLEKSTPLPVIDPLASPRISVAIKPKDDTCCLQDRDDGVIAMDVPEGHSCNPLEKTRRFGHNCTHSTREVCTELTPLQSLQMDTPEQNNQQSLAARLALSYQKEPWSSQQEFNNGGDQPGFRKTTGLPGLNLPYPPFPEDLRRTPNRSGAVRVRRRPPAGYAGRRSLGSKDRGSPPLLADGLCTPAGIDLEIMSVSQYGEFPAVLAQQSDFTTSAKPEAISEAASAISSLLPWPCPGNVVRVPATGSSSFDVPHFV